VNPGYRLTSSGESTGLQNPDIRSSLAGDPGLSFSDPAFLPLYRSGVKELSISILRDLF